MDKGNDYILDKTTLSNITNIIDSVTSNTSRTFEDLKAQYDNLVSCWVICKYSSIIYFGDFYFIRYFDKTFIFCGSVELAELKNIVTKDEKFKNFIYAHAIGLIVEDKLLSNFDFTNLKNCYMLTELITFKENKVHCQYTPYYGIQIRS